MKKIIISLFLASLLLSALLVSGAIAETAITTQKDTFLFRNIPWYTTQRDVQNALSGLTTSSNRSGVTIPDWFQRWNNIDGDMTVEAGGCLTRYKDVNVAGYKAGLCVYYLYPIVDGKTVKADDSAEMYLAIYEFATLSDMPAVYDDLITKLTKLYGESGALNNPDNWTSFNGRLWKAADGSQIWLRLYHMYDNYTLKLSYIAPDCTARLDALAAQLLQEKVDAEAEERQQNQDNTEGL